MFRSILRASDTLSESRDPTVALASGSANTQEYQDSPNWIALWLSGCTSGCCSATTNTVVPIRESTASRAPSRTPVLERSRSVHAHMLALNTPSLYSTQNSGPGTDVNPRMGVKAIARQTRSVGIYSLPNDGKVRPYFGLNCLPTYLRSLPPSLARISNDCW